MHAFRITLPLSAFSRSNSTATRFPNKPNAGQFHRSRYFSRIFLPGRAIYDGHDRWGTAREDRALIRIYYRRSSSVKRNENSSERIDTLARVLLNIPLCPGSFGRRKIYARTFIVSGSSAVRRSFRWKEGHVSLLVGSIWNRTHGQCILVASGQLRDSPGRSLWPRLRGLVVSQLAGDGSRPRRSSPPALRTSLHAVSFRYCCCRPRSVLSETTPI